MEELTNKQLSRFWDKVDKKGPEDCWTWTACKNTHGYGGFRVNDRREVAHRVSYRIHHGDPEGTNVLHSCDNPQCVNPNHLRAGTKKDNACDMARRGRQQKQKLSVDDVLEIVTLVKGRRLTRQVISEKYNVTKSIISGIVTGRSWSHTTGIKHEPKHLSEVQVLAIHRSVQEGLPQKTIASMYEVTRSCVNDIATGKTHPRVTGIKYNPRKRK